MTHQQEVARLWNKIVHTAPLLGPSIRELVDREIINELKTFTGISNEIPESEILARIKELEKTL